MISYSAFSRKKLSLFVVGLFVFTSFQGSAFGISRMVEFCKGEIGPNEANDSRFIAACYDYLDSTLAENGHEMGNISIFSSVEKASRILGVRPDTLESFFGGGGSGSGHRVCDDDVPYDCFGFGGGSGSGHRHEPR